MTPPPRLTYTVTRQEALALGLEVAGETPFIRGFRRHGWWVCALTWLGVLIDINWPLDRNATHNNEPAPILGTIVTLAVIIPLSLLFGLGTAKILRHMGRGWLEAPLKNLPDSHFAAERWTEATNDQFIIHFPEMEARYPWTSVKELRSRPNHLALLGNNGQAIVVIPIHAFASPEAQKEFSDYCQARITSVTSAAPRIPRQSWWKRTTGWQKASLLFLFILLLLAIISYLVPLPSPQ